MATGKPVLGKVVPLAAPDAAIRKVLIGDLVLPTMIGIFKREKLAPQRVRFNIEVGVVDRPPRQDKPSEIVCYDRIVKGVRALVAQGHVNLVETLAERVAELCLADPAALYARVRVEKLDIYPDAAAVGVEIERRREVR